MLAWGIIVGIIAMGYIFPILDYFILFNVEVAKTKVQLELKKYNEEEQPEKSCNAIGFRYYEPEDGECMEDDLEFGKTQKNNLT